MRILYRVFPLLVLAGHAAFGQNEPALVPQPVQLQRAQGSNGRAAFAQLAGTWTIRYDAGDDALGEVAAFLAERLADGFGGTLPVEPAPDAPSGSADSIRLTTVGADASLGAEGYELVVSADSILVRAPSPQGAFYGVQTLRQLLPAEFRPPVGGTLTSVAVPCVHIRDFPRYKWRGSLLDCGRHFMSVDFVKRYIDLLAYHKMNVLHWHLTDDQGWRFEIGQYPRLTKIGAWRAGTRPTEWPRRADGKYGGFYTQDEIREVVAYAKRRFVMVVPEIEMPGHSVAALAAYPDLSCTGGPFEVRTEWGVQDDVFCAGNDAVFTFLENVLSEVIELFPSEYIHVGGDECPKGRWQQCSKCQGRIRDEALADEHGLQSYFIRRIEKFLNDRGRRLIGWDEILEGGLAPNATVQSWRGLEGAVAAASSGHDVISSPTSHCYLDYPQSAAEPNFGWMGRTTIEQCYAFEPTPADLTEAEGRHVLGLEGNMWTEQAPSWRVDWQVFPRLCALAEVGWSPREARDWQDFSRRMERANARLGDLGVRHYVPASSAIEPVGREDNAWWMQRHELLNGRAKQGGELVFIGDSITQGWEDAGRAVWQEFYADRQAVNLGISGDRTQHVLWRFAHGHLEGLESAPVQPRLAVIMIGTNNSNGADNSAEEIADGIVRIVQSLRFRLPEMKILLLGVFPRGEFPGPQREKNALASRLAAQVADGQMVRYLDIGEHFLRPDGSMSPDVMPDFLHPSGAGYRIWAEAIESSVSAMLGADR